MLGFLQYTVEAGVVFAVLVLIYRHVYYGISYNKWERGYLLASTVLSYLLPLLKVGHEIRPAPRAEDRVIELLDKTDDWQMVVVSRLHDSESIVSKITHSTLFDTCITVLFAVYVAGAAVKLVTFVRGLMKTSSLKGRGAVKVQSIEGVDVYKTDLETVAFSFFRNIFIGKKSAGLNPDELDIIIRHEMQHVKGLHSVDTVVFGLYSVLQWFNPMSRIAARYSRVVCENIADTGAVGDGGLTEYSRLVLRLGLTNIAKVSAPRPKRRSALVDRIAQLLSGDGEKIRRVRFFAALPVLVLVVAAYVFMFGMLFPRDPRMDVPVKGGYEVTVGFFSDHKICGADGIVRVVSHRLLNLELQPDARIVATENSTADSVGLKGVWLHVDSYEVNVGGIKPTIVPGELSIGQEIGKPLDDVPVSIEVKDTQGRAVDPATVFRF